MIDPDVERSPSPEQAAPIHQVDFFQPNLSNNIIRSFQDHTADNVAFVAAMNAEHAENVARDINIRRRIKTRRKEDIHLFKYSISRRGELYDRELNLPLVPIANENSVIQNYDMRYQTLPTQPIQNVRIPIEEMVLDTFNGVDLKRKFYVHLDYNQLNNHYHNLRRFNLTELSQHFLKRVRPILLPQELISPILNRKHKFPYYLITSFGRLFTMNPERAGGTNVFMPLLPPPPDQYRSVRLPDANGIYRSTTILSLIASTFLGPIPLNSIMVFRDNNPNNIHLNNIHYEVIGPAIGVFDVYLNRLITSGWYEHSQAIRSTAISEHSQPVAPLILQEDQRGPHYSRPMMIAVGVQAFGYRISAFGVIHNMNNNNAVVQHFRSDFNRVNLIIKGVNRLYLVHRLVAFTFLGDSYSNQKNVANHINGNTEDNFAGNLQWVTHENNPLYLSPQRVLMTYTGANATRVIFRCHIDATLRTGVQDIVNVIRNSPNGIHEFNYNDYLGLPHAAVLSFYHDGDEFDEIDREEMIENGFNGVDHQFEPMQE